MTRDPLAVARDACPVGVPAPIRWPIRDPLMADPAPADGRSSTGDGRSSTGDGRSSTG
jgi:hypothetical protein